MKTLLASATLSTLDSPTIDLVIPDTVPVNVGEANGAFNASRSDNPPISDVVKPVTVPLNVALLQTRLPVAFTEKLLFRFFKVLVNVGSSIFSCVAICDNMLAISLVSWVD